MSDVTLATEDSGYCNGGAHLFLNISATGVLIYGELNNKYILGRGDFEKFHEKFRPSGIWQR